MLSKEEIEKTKEILNDSIEYGTFGRSCRNNRNKLDTKAYKALEIAMRYIEQLEQEKADRINADSYENSYIAKLESREQKLIEKLEEDTNKPIPLAEDMGWVKCRKEYAKEILEILKKE